MSRKAELLKNTIIIGVGKISTQFISLLLLPLYTHYLSRSQYGYFDLILSYMYLVVPIISLQMEMTLFRFLVDARGNDRKVRVITSAAFRLVLLGTAVIFIFGVFGLITSFTDNVLSLVSLFTSTLLANFSLQFARGIGNNRLFALSSMFASITILIMTVLLVTIGGQNISGALWGISAGNLACFLLIFFKMKLNLYISSEIDKRILWEMLKYSLPLVPNGAALWGVSAANRTIISMLIGVAANGLFAVANKFSMVLNSLFGILYISWTESISLHIHDKDKDDYISNFFDMLLRIFGSICIGIIALSPPLFKIFIDKNFQTAILLVPALIVGGLLGIVVSFYGTIYIAAKQTAKIATTTLAAAVLNIGFTVIGVRYWGLRGAAIAVPLAYAFVIVVRHFDIRSYVTIKYNLSTILLVTFGISIASLILFNPFRYSGYIALFTAMIISGLLVKNELSLIRKQIFNTLLKTRQ